MESKILVTGGAGYIGSIFVPDLLQKGYSVTVLDNFMYHQNSLLSMCYHPNLNIIVGDVRDEKLLKSEIQAHDIIVPLAAIVGAPAAACLIFSDICKITFSTESRLSFGKASIASTSRATFPHFSADCR